MCRSQCPICQKSYKTPDWLKDHIRRGHGYTKEVFTPIMLNHLSEWSNKTHQNPKFIKSCLCRQLTL